MAEAVFLVLLGAFAILSTAGWFVISSPIGKRRGRSADAVSWGISGSEKMGGACKLAIIFPTDFSAPQ